MLQGVVNLKNAKQKLLSTGQEYKCYYMS